MEWHPGNQIDNHFCCLSHHLILIWNLGLNQMYKCINKTLCGDHSHSIFSLCVSNLQEYGFKWIFLYYGGLYCSEHESYILIFYIVFIDVLNL